MRAIREFFVRFFSVEPVFGVQRHF